MVDNDDDDDDVDDDNKGLSRVSQFSQLLVQRDCPPQPTADLSSSHKNRDACYHTHRPFEEGTSEYYEALTANLK